jgi:ribosome-interacting GTPase 1
MAKPSIIMGKSAAKGFGLETMAIVRNLNFTI